MADRGQSTQDARRRYGEDDAHGGRRDRRRSRSPGHRSDRRGFGDNVDSYSSSRNYREREREDRYTGGRDAGGRDSGGRDAGGRDRRDRDWDRDRGSARRDARRDDDGRRRDPRRDRDDVYDRRPPPRRDDRDRDRRDVDKDRGRDREDMRQLERQAARKSPSPAPKPKEPTPPLDDVVSVLERKRRMTMWDIKPSGYENVTSEQAKLSGLFPLPGAPRQQQMDPAKLQAFMNQPGNQASGAALKPSTARQAKRLFVSNYPASATDESLLDFFNLQLNALNITHGTNPGVSVQGTKVEGSNQVVLELKTAEDATTALALNGIQMESDADTHMAENGEANGASKGLQLRRPADYIAPIASDETENEAGLLSNTIPDTPNKLVLHGVATYLEEEQISDLCGSFGELKRLVLVRDEGSAANKGFAFLEYKTDEGTNGGLANLAGIQVGEQPLRVERACVGIEQVGGEMSVNAMSLIAGGKSATTTAGRVLCLMNMITPEELMDAEEADEIFEDVKEECTKYGKLLDVKMPRPTGGSRLNSGVGKIYLKYEVPENASKALAALAGRKFADRTVVVTYFAEEYFDVNAW